MTLAPMDTPPDGTVLGRASRSRAQVGGLIILALIDDDALFERAVRRSMQSRGYSVRAFTCVRHALEDPDLHLMNVILLDVHLGEESGIDGCLALRQEARFAGPIIMISGDADHGTRIQARRAGANDYVTKPFDAVDLDARVRVELAVNPFAAPTDLRHVEFGAVRLHPNRCGAWVEGEYREIAPKRFWALQELVQLQGAPLTRERIEERIQGGKRGPEACRNLIYWLRRDIGCKRDLIRSVDHPVKGWALSPSGRRKASGTQPTVAGAGPEDRDRQRTPRK